VVTFGNVFEIHTNWLTCSKFYSTSLKVFWGLPLNIKIDTCGYKTARQEAAHKKKRGNINVIESKLGWTQLVVSFLIFIANISLPNIKSSRKKISLVYLKSTYHIWKNFKSTNVWRLENSPLTSWHPHVHSWPGPTFGRAEGSQARRLSHNAGKDYEPVRYTCGVSYLYKGPIKIGKLGVKEAYLLIGGPHCTPFINDCQCWPTIVGRFHSWKQKKHDFLVLLLGETWGDWFPNFVVWCFRCTAPTSLKTAPISFKTPFPSKKND